MTFTPDATNGLAYYWTFGDGGFSTQLLPTHAYASQGTYTVSLQVTDTNGCITTESKVVCVYPLPVVAITQTSNNCTTMNVTLTATPGYPSYAWSNGMVGSSITVTQSGNYAVTVTSENGCQNTASMQVNQHTLCQAPTGQVVTGINIPNAILNWTAVNCAVAYRIQYRIAGTNPPGTTINVAAPATSVQITGLVANTTYEWRIRTNCGSEPYSTWSPYQQFSTGVAKAAVASAESVAPDPMLFPNPNDGSFTVKYHAAEMAEVEVCVWDATGKLLFCEQKVAAEGENTWEMDFHLSAGIYFFHIDPVKQGQGEAKRIRFVVE